MVVLGEVEGTPVQDGTDQCGGFDRQDLEWALPLLSAVGPDEIEVEPVGGDLAPEVGRAGEGFTVEELIFDEAVDGFDITLPGVTFGRDVTMV